MPLWVTSPRYHVDIGPHVFPTRKYGLIVRRLRDEDGVREADLVEPGLASEADVLRVHTRSWWDRCRTDSLSRMDEVRLELPWSPALFEASSRAVQGSITAARLALAHGAGLHIGGGFHHAFPDHGEGFCVFNDVAVAVRTLQSEASIRRALIVDVDLHHGNGTAAIFADDADVATFSIHDEANYPAFKPPSTVDVGLAPGTGDAEYLQALHEGLLPLLARQRPDLLVYVAGADPYEDDQLGSLGLSMDGLWQRDDLVVQACRQRGVPMLVVLAGGYARRVADTVAIHLQTLRLAATLWR